MFVTMLKMNFDGNFRYTGCELIAVVELFQESKGDIGQNFCDDVNSDSNKSKSYILVDDEKENF